MTSLEHIEAAIEARCKRLAEDVDEDVDAVAEEVERLLDLHGKATEAAAVANELHSVAAAPATTVNLAPTESTKPAPGLHTDA